MINNYYLLMVSKNVSISLREDQIEFIEEQSRFFSLSKFVQDKLDKYIRLIKNGKKTIN